MVTRNDYREESIQAARSVLLELTHLLGEFRDDIVLVGGWVPELILPDSEPPYLGSLDVDLALNHKTMRSDTYQTICKLLKDKNYREGNQPFIFLRDVKINGKIYEVQVDLLAGEYEGTSKSHRHQKVQDVMARKTRGCDLAFEHPLEVRLEGTLPEGGKDSVSVRVASIVPFIVMKSMALVGRIKEKDAWDIHFCIENYPGGIPALAEVFKPFLSHGLVKEGLRNIAEKFASVDHVGPKFVADFDQISDEANRLRVHRESFERIRALLDLLGF